MPVIDRASFELTSNAPDVEKGFSNLIRTMSGANDQVKQSQEEVLRLSNAHSILMGQIDRLNERHAALQTAMRAGTMSSEELAKAKAQEATMMRQADTIAEKAAQTHDKLAISQAKLADVTQQSGNAWSSFGSVLTNFASHPLQTAQAGMTGLLEAIGPTAVGIAGAAAAIGIAAKAMYDFAAGAAENAERLHILSAMTGLAAQDLQALEKVAEKMGFTGLDLGRSISYLNQQLARDPKQFTEGMDKLGISLTDLATGRPKDAYVILNEVSLALQAIKDPGERAAAQAEVLGVRYRELATFLGMLKGSLTENAQAMKDWGRVTNEETTKYLLQFEDSIKTVKGTWDSFRESLIAGLMKGTELSGGLQIIPPHETSSGTGPEPFVGPTNPARFTAWNKEAQAELSKWEMEDFRKNLAEKKKIQDEHLTYEFDRYVEHLKLMAAAQKALTKDLIANDDDQWDRVMKAREGLISATGHIQTAAGEPDAVLNKMDEEALKSEIAHWELTTKLGVNAMKPIRDAAGHVFDDLVTGSALNFKTLLKTFEGFFLTPLRMEFQNLAQRAFSGMGAAIPLTGAGAASEFVGPIQSHSFMGVSGKSGNLMTAAAAMGGILAMSDAFSRGGTAGIFEGIGGGAAMGAAIGSMYPVIGTAIGAAIGGMVGLFTGLFGGSEARRRRDAELVAAMQKPYLMPAQRATSQTGAFGLGSDLDVAFDVTGRMHAYGGPSFAEMIRHEKDLIIEMVNEGLISGGNPLADSVAWIAKG
jgi:hypothetical protein